MVAARPAHGQAAGAAPPKIGLVLSGGSAKGFAHIGVIRVLERAGLAPDVVTGTSMGAIIGGLYATGIGPDSLVALARGLPWDGMLSDRTDRRRTAPDRRALGGRTLVSVPIEGRRVRLPSGMVEGAAIYRVLADLTWPWAASRDFRRLPLPFAALATDLETGEAVRLEGGVLVDALRASMAIPGAVEPIVIDGRILVDGGLARNLPAEDALALGADVLVCSDVSDPLNRADELESLVEVLLQAVAFRMDESSREQRRLCDVLIRPDIQGLSSTAFDRGVEWTGRGETAAEQALLPWLAEGGGGSGLRGSRAAAARSEGSRAAPAALSDSVFVTAVRLTGIEDPRARRLAARIVDLQPPGWLSRARLDGVLAELSASGLFQDVRYRLDASPGDTTLVLLAAERTEDELGLGLRYDDHFGASLLFTGTFTNRIRYGSVTRAHVRLGEEVQVQVSYLRGRGVTSPFSLGSTVGWTRAPLDFREEGTTLARVLVDVLAARSLVGSTVGRATIAGVDVGGEWVRGGTVVAPLDSAHAVALLSGAVMAFRETFDDPDFPRTGSRLYLRSELGTEVSDAGGFFHHHVVDVLVAVPLVPRLTLLLGGFAGGAGGDGLPLHRRFFLGGATTSAVFPATQPSFLGLAPQERSGTVAHVARAGLRWEVRPGRHLTLSADGGGTPDRWRFERGAYTVGWGASVSATSLVGPVVLTVHGRSLNDTGLALSVGRAF